MSTVLTDFGDNTTSNALYNYHYYPNNGTYDISITLWSGACIYEDSIEVDLGTLQLEDEENQKEEIKIHYSKEYGLKLFNTDPIKSVEIYGLDGKLIDAFSYGGERSLPYYGTNIIFRYETQTGEWRSERLIAI